jgi:hypothetical protein
LQQKNVATITPFLVSGLKQKVKQAIDLPKENGNAFSILKDCLAFGLNLVVGYRASAIDEETVKTFK